MTGLKITAPKFNWPPVGRKYGAVVYHQRIIWQKVVPACHKLELKRQIVNEHQHTQPGLVELPPDQVKEPWHFLGLPANYGHPITPLELPMVQHCLFNLRDIGGFNVKRTNFSAIGHLFGPAPAGRCCQLLALQPAGETVQRQGYICTYHHPNRMEINSTSKTSIQSTTLSQSRILFFIAFPSSLDLFCPD